MINFIFKPQINKINYNELFIELIHDNYLINNCCKKDEKRFLNKKIKHCIISLNNDKPLFIDINEEYINNYNEINEIIKNGVKHYYMESNGLLFRYFNYHIKNKPKDYKNGIKYILDKLKISNKLKKVISLLMILLPIYI